MSWTRAYWLAAVCVLVAGCAQPARSVPAGPAAASVPLAAQAAYRAVPGRCPPDAVFVRLDTEIRGYPSTAAGVTRPCALISGPRTQLLERGPITISVHGDLHSLSFQANGTNGLTIQGSNATGDAAPLRVANADQDHVALAVDSAINDYIVASEEYTGDNCWYVVPNRATGPSRSNCDNRVAAIHALAIDPRNELLVAGTDIVGGAGRIDVFADPAASSPRRVRSIVGPATGLASLSGTLGYYDISFSLTTDPQSGTIYVYDHLFNVLGGGAIPGAAAAKISEFAADANGNVAPTRTLSGPLVRLVAAAFGVDILGVDRRGELFVLTAATSPVISVFGAAAHGNAPPLRSFADPSATIGPVGAGLAVR